MTIERKSLPQRDFDRTGFTPMLRNFASEVPGMRAVVFCDHDGEVVDYHSYYDTFDTKITGALFGILRSTIRRECPRHAGNDLRDLVIETDEHVLFLRPITADYYLAGMAERDTVIGKLYAALDDVHALLLTEAGL